MPSSSEETGPNGTISLAPVYSIRIQAATPLLVVRQGLNVIVMQTLQLLERKL